MRVSLTARTQTMRVQREAVHRLRDRRAVTQRDGVRCAVDGRTLLDFCSNDYLGLSQHPQVIAAMCDGASTHGAGGVASHLVCGHAEEHAALERDLADWLQCDAALLFGSGYLANLAVVQGLLAADDVCVQDKLNHASLIDAARLSGCILKRYPHGDAEGAARQLVSQPDGAALLATDGVFSMDGDVAPLCSLADVAREHGATLYVDDAHGIGVMGEAGRGSVAAGGLSQQEVPLRLVTFGKALGNVGAAVVGDPRLIDHLSQVARPGIYTTAMPAAQAAAIRAAVAITRDATGDALRDKLHTNIVRFREAATRHGLDLMASDTAIQPLLAGEDADALAMSSALEARGYWVVAIRPPTVPEGRARLRVTLSASHAAADIEGLVDALAKARDEVMP